ncbi:hypothetical protein [uncultured Kiloniella sp.]|uniref:hypothetical protein n=1 Tax=uncultured Kiloniella sp. TaxID=1133091 RepID=UPI0026254622|nr:hypothetical protein [uncultured Kiloniella sp.]
MNKSQDILSVAGQAPAIGIVVDLTNATISIIRGNYTDAASRAGSVIGNGSARTATVAKVANEVNKAIEKAVDEASIR